MDNTYKKYNSDLVAHLAKDNFRLLGMISVLKDILNEFLCNRSGFIEKKALSILSDMADGINNEIKKKIMIEQKVLFKELEKQFSELCSTDQMREDHITIGALASFISIVANKKSYSEYIDNKITGLINNFYKIFKKHTYKTSEMLYYEMETFLTKDELQQIYNKLTI